jgi:hypothetical protein
MKPFLSMLDWLTLQKEAKEACHHDDLVAPRAYLSQEMTPPHQEVIVI